MSMGGSLTCLRRTRGEVGRERVKERKKYIVPEVWEEVGPLELDLYQSK